MVFLNFSGRLFRWALRVATAKLSGALWLPWWRRCLPFL